MYPYIKSSDVVVGKSVFRMVPGRDRYTFGNRLKSRSITFPTSVFCTSYLDGLDEPPTACAIYMRSVLRDNALFVRGKHIVPICFGRVAAIMIRAGMLDPVDAFWMTGHLNEYAEMNSLTTEISIALSASLTYPDRYFTSV